MDKKHQEQQIFLQEQLQWCKNQDAILEEIEDKLHEMKRIAEYAHEHELTPAEIDKLNVRLNELKHEVFSLEKKLESKVH